ncbi:23S rRNA (adenine(2503)-C(2))-methyltransferase RlmN [Schlesneria sp. DSM 10557]|uniref:23S rRNA (adenine(2503)-C(2))-methyltransferase RlmN n=1 Tax=Schlesneria sp. DSM 10557 TaxID=3044399 RepID=UPI0035A00569
MSTPKIVLTELTRVQLAESLAELGIDSRAIKAVWNGVYVRGLTDFSQMDTLARKTQAKLAEHFTLARPTISRELISTDGTRKWLLEWTDGQRVESVFIPETDRGALCISSQIGCTLSCSFCHTGTMRLARNLTAAEIVAQVLNARDRLQEWGRKRTECLCTNLVLMGMGEPLFNYDHVARALRIIMDGDGIGISRRRIMLSTAGVVPMIERVGRELGVNLAISLHAVRDDLRNELVPLNKKYPISELLRACREYPAASNARRITFEYVMLKDLNDSDADARELVRLLQGIHAKVNLIPWNPWPGAAYQTSTPERIQAFARNIGEGGFSSAVRATRGEDIMAACGQLKSEAENLPPSLLQLQR